MLMELKTKRRAGCAGIENVYGKKWPMTFFLSSMIIFQFAAARPRTNAVYFEDKLLVQQQLIKGTVSDEFGVSIEGANVMNKKTKTAVHTDADGNFTIEANDDKTTLVISFMGMETQEVKVKDTKISLEIVLKKALEKLNDVVVLGYTKVKRENLVGSVQTLTEKEINTQPARLISQLLEGKIAGLNATRGLVIRGLGTLNNSNPLWVVDGVPQVRDGDGDKNQSDLGIGQEVKSSMGPTVNPNDIETLTVLKDASSTAMYGSRGANGVIIVTTKKGKKGKPRIGFSSNFGFSTFYNGRYSLMNGAELYDYYNSFPNKEEFSSNWWWTPELRNKDFNWQNVGITSDPTSDYNLSFGGGSDNSSLYIGLGANIQNNPYKSSASYTGLLTASYDMYDWLSVSTSINYSLTKADAKENPQAGGNSYLPWDSPYLPDGSLRPGPPPHPTWVNSHLANPLSLKSRDYSTDNTNTFSGFISFNFKLSSALTFSSIINYGITGARGFAFTDPRTAGPLFGEGGITYLNNTMISNNVSNQLSYTKNLENHRFNALLAYDWNEQDESSIPASGRGVYPGLIMGPTSKPGRPFQGTRKESATQSFLSVISNTYKGKYNAQVSLRWDGASSFPPTAQYNLMYSGGLSWNIDKENFFESSIIKGLSLSANFGNSGNRPNNAYLFLEMYSLDSPYNEQLGAKIMQYRNTSISWETSYTTNVGININFWDRLDLQVSAYNKNTANLLDPAPLPRIIGTNQGVWRNVGSAVNRGIELSLGLTLIQNDNCNWKLNANSAYNENKITSLIPSQLNTKQNTTLKIGEPIGSLYMVEWAGVDPQTGQGQWFTTNDKGERVKTFKYSEAQNYQAIVGRSNPFLVGGFSTDLTYKNFNFGAYFSYQIGGMDYAKLRESMDSDGAYPDTNQMNLNPGWSRWQKPGDIATHPQAIYGNKTNSNAESSRYLEPAGFLALNSIFMSYTVNSKPIPISLGLNVGNVFEFSRSSIPRGGGTYNTRTFSFSINFNL